MSRETGSPADWWFEDFAVGQVFRTQGRTITEADIASFAGWSWDTNPVHTDAEHAGDTLHCTIRIAGARATSNGENGVLDREFVLRKQDGTDVQRGSIGLLVARRPA